MDLKEFVLKALYEDIDSGDHTSLACIDPATKSDAKLIVKDAGIIAGVNVAQEILRLIDAEITFNAFIKDGVLVKPGEVAFEINGSVQSILKAERLVLNIMQRMSGIATETSKYVSEVKDFHVKILDTRKTTPLFRFFEKEAVRIGGGFNHRMGLFDMIMIKDNHIDYAGGISTAIKKAQNYLEEKNLDLKIEIETRNINEVKEVLRSGGVHRIMLDNFEFAVLKEAIQVIDRKYETEASGGINLQNVKSYAETGVDFISVGRLTHSYKSLDMSLKAKKS